MTTWVSVQHPDTGVVDTFTADNDGPIAPSRLRQWLGRRSWPLLRHLGLVCWQPGDRVWVASSTRVWTRDACTQAESMFRQTFPGVEIKFVETPPCPGCGRLWAWYAVCTECHQTAVNEQRCFARCEAHQRRDVAKV